MIHPRVVIRRFAPRAVEQAPHASHREDPLKRIERR
jgi:hypothetical protein